MSQIFLAHAKEDREAVIRLYRYLKESGYCPWMDELDLLPGQDWEFEIEKAIEASRYFLACLSKQSVAKHGFVQREFRKALEEASKKPRGSIFVIPVRLDACDVPSLQDYGVNLRKFQWVDLFSNDGYERLFKVLTQDLSTRPTSQAAFNLQNIQKQSQESSDFKTVNSVHRPVSSPAGKNPVVSKFGRVVKRTFQVNGADFDMPTLVEIPAGKYSTSGVKNKSYLKVIHDFEIGQFPITFKQYDLFCETSGYKQPDDMGWGREDRPVINVSFLDAMNYVEWLCQQTGREYRLPTATEWEYAARAGTDSAYWWGNEIRLNHQVMANCDGCGDKWERRTSPIGSFSSNDWNLYDTFGNVWEWTHTIYTDSCEKGEYVEKPSIVNALCRAVVKGGSWYDQPERLHWSTRELFWVDGRSSSIGFRIAYSS
ncbi:MAG: SUMF1/EgtB/PvdO family nonheme iron enzyme [Cyanobacteria bacterium J06649_5]